MMKHVKLAVTGVLVASTMLIGTATTYAMSTTNGAQATAPVCTLKAVGSKNTANQQDSRFTVNGTTISASVVVTGPQSCKRDVTFTTWEAPNPDAGKPYNQQTLFMEVTKTFGVGTHPISVQLPNCFFQADLTTVPPANNHVGNSYPNGDYLGSLHGGTQSCTPVTPAQPQTPSSTTSSLPNTGSGLMPFMVALSVGAAVTGFSYFKQLRKVNSIR